MEVRYSLLLLSTLSFCLSLQSMIKEEPPRLKWIIDELEKKDIEALETKTLNEYLSVISKHLKEQKYEKKEIEKSVLFHLSAISNELKQRKRLLEKMPLEMIGLIVEKRLERFINYIQERIKPYRILEGHTEEINSAQFSPDGDKIVTASRDGTARIWDVKTDEIFKILKHTDFVLSAQFNPDGDKIVTALRDGTARIWDLKTGKIKTLEGHTGAVHFAQFSPDGIKIVTASGDRTVKIWDIEGKLLETLKGHADSVYSVQFSPDGIKIVTASYDGTVIIWDVETGKRLKTFRVRVHTGQVYFAQFSPDSKKIVIASSYGTAIIWNVKTGEIKTLKGHTDWVLSAQFNPDGDKIVTASWDNTAIIWDLKTGKIKTLEGHTDAVTYAQFNPDGDKIVTASHDGTAIIWDLEDGLMLVDQLIKEKEPVTEEIEEKESLKLMKKARKIQQIFAQVEIIMQAYEATEKGKTYKIKRGSSEHLLLERLHDGVKKLLRRYLNITLVGKPPKIVEEPWWKFWRW